MLNSLQSQNLDSLWNVWEDRKQHDTIRLKALHDFTFKGYLRSMPDSAVFYAIIERDYALFKNLKWEAAGAYNTLGAAYYFMGLYDSAIVNYQRSLQLKLDIGNKASAAKTMNNIGLLFHDRGDYKQALHYLEKALLTLEEIQDTLSLSSTLGNIGLVYEKRGNYPLAIETYSRSMKLAEMIGDRRALAGALGNIGNLYYIQLDWDKAISYYRKCLLIETEDNNLKGMSTAYHNIGAVHLGQKDYKNAKESFEKALEIDLAIGNKRGLANAYSSLGQAFELSGELKKAEEYYLQSLTLNEEMVSWENIADNYTNLSNLYYAFGNLSKAEKYAREGLEIAQDIGSVKSSMNAAQALYSALKSQDKKAEALDLHELYVTLRDSMQNEKNTKALIEQQFLYEYEKQEALRTAEQERKDAMAFEAIRRKNLQRNASITGFVLMILLAGVFFAQRNRIAKEQKRSEELLLNILPAEVAEELKEKGTAEARHFDDVTVLFTDFKGFTQLSERLSPQQLVEELNECFSEFDRIVADHHVEKIKTIGDAYMAAGGLPSTNETHAADVVKVALAMASFMKNWAADKQAAGVPSFELRIGVHTGPVVAGIVGIKKFQYDIWGDTVNTASRMESSGEVGRVNISEATYQRISNQFSCIHRGEIEAKGKGKINMYFVEGQII